MPAKHGKSNTMNALILDQKNGIMKPGKKSVIHDVMKG